MATSTAAPTASPMGSRLVASRFPPAPNTAMTLELPARLLASSRTASHLRRVRGGTSSPCLTGIAGASRISTHARRRISGFAVVSRLARAAAMPESAGMPALPPTMTTAVVPALPEGLPAAPPVVLPTARPAAPAAPTMLGEPAVTAAPPALEVPPGVSLVSAAVCAMLLRLPPVSLLVAPPWEAGLFSTLFTVHATAIEPPVAINAVSCANR
jgi:hypothetical protein